MNRADFIKNSGKLILGNAILFSVNRHSLALDELSKSNGNFPRISIALEEKFKTLVGWLQSSGWNSFIHQHLGVDINSNAKDLNTLLTGELNKDKIHALCNDYDLGFDDFIGTQLIKPGFPSYSLLYHALASPRVVPNNVEFPDLEKIDLLEDYIYSLSNWEELQKAYNFKNNEEFVAAVFAYEYRPAFKTPHHEYADLVFSRTGIARVGNKPRSYNAVTRAFTNKPENKEDEKQVAVTPARYGLFLARKVNEAQISLMKTDQIRESDTFSDVNDEEFIFLQPIRKLFNNDVLLNNNPVKFSESHKSEKLFRLCHNKSFEMFEKRFPTPKTSADLIDQGESRNMGSSFLVCSQDKPLIRIAREDNRCLFFKVPPVNGQQRFFAAFNTMLVGSEEILDPTEHDANDYSEPRNQALFVHIGHEMLDPVNCVIRQIKRGPDSSFDDQINKGEYWAPLFEDSICEGRVSAKIQNFDISSLSKIKIKKDFVPAFSIVTAPDFFPQVDAFDLLSFDVNPGNSKETNFYEGGISSLASERMPPDPKTIGLQYPELKNTYTAVLTTMSKSHGLSSTQSSRANFNQPTAERNYRVSGYLPDVSSSIFAPGWDITYAGNEGNLYLSTHGLGSPFVEDMKLCSAMNGMWPAASPDAARTYQGSLTEGDRNPTSIPLLDDEIGFHPDSPRGDGLNTTGWDGEQGPFLEYFDGKWNVNFTDLARADSVENALNGLLDVSKLRNLTSKEILSRMKCLQKCIQVLPMNNFRAKHQWVSYTWHWLISAEKVNWGKENASGWGIPAKLIGANKDWITQKTAAKVEGEGYLFVFADTSYDDENKKIWVNGKRRRLVCENIYVCQVTVNKVAAAKIENGIATWY